MTGTAAISAVSVLVWWLSAMPSSAFAQDPHQANKQQKPPTATTPTAQESHQHQAPADQKPELPSSIPPVTDEDRKAAFPEVHGHTVHDNAVNYLVLFDQFEWQAGNGTTGMNIDSRGWVGRDRDRLWFRAEGHGEHGRVGEAQAHALYGRHFSRWWDVVAGVRQDFRPGSPQTWAAIGIQGLAPYWFDVEATAYVGASGRTHARFEVEYELLFTNRLILQPLFEADIFGKSDPERRVGAGLSTTDLGFRVRYEINRECAPYVGVTWRTKWGKTEDFAEDAGEESGGARFVAGLRWWF